MGRHYEQLSLSDRIEIYRLHADGKSNGAIARAIGRHTSTIGRELRRNSVATKVWPGGYEPVRADALAARRRRWDPRFKLARQPDLEAHVRQLLAMGWSPEQISGRLALEKHPITISKEAIYRYVDHCVAQKDYLNRLLPQAKYRRGKAGQRGGSPVNFIKDRVSIAHRPKSVASRSRFGHWENDGMSFRHNKETIIISHERKSRLVLATRQTTKTAAQTFETLMTHYRSLPEAARRSTTFDNGTEFADHWQLNSQIGMATYFCDTHSPWQKGGVENAIQRLRRYLPRKASPAALTDNDFNIIIKAYNSTPRKCLGFKTPAEVFMKNLKPLHFNRDSTSRLSPG
jgi:transposase, IS30 family